MTTSGRSQIRCFSKLPAVPGSISLLPNIGELLRAEMKDKSPCGGLEKYVIEGKHLFNRQLRTGSYLPPAIVRKTLQEWRTQVDLETREFLTRCQVVHHVFPELNGIQHKGLRAAIATARAKVSEDLAFVRSVYALFQADGFPSEAPAPNLISRDWAFFLWLQCSLLAALRLFERRQGTFSEAPSAKALERAEHSMHDVEYVMFGALAGTVASNDKEVISDFLSVRPEGRVISTMKVRGGV